MSIRQKILIVDDISANLKALQVSLSKVDADIISATSGNEGLILTLQHKFSLILLDVQMPVMDGFEMAEHLQHEQSTANIPIIFVTAFSREEKNVFQGYQSGAVDYLFKPIDTTILLSKVNIFLQLDKVTQALNAHKKELERTVENRTRELSIALDKAELANAAKTEFLSNMSHEMRTPLHAILSFSRFGLKAMDKGECRNLERYFDRIKTSGERLLGLVDNLLDLAQLESGKMELNLTSNNVMELMQSCVSELEANFNENELTVVWKTSEFNRLISCDSVRIKQVISNLLSNAIKFSEAGCSIFIEIGEYKATDGNQSQPDFSGILCTVADQGVGIPADELDSVFEQFVQSSKTKTNAGGTGLGLAISQEIIELHQGKIWAEQREENGTVFKFILPYSC